MCAIAPGRSICTDFMQQREREMMGMQIQPPWNLLPEAYSKKPSSFCITTSSSHLLPVLCPPHYISFLSWPEASQWPVAALPCPYSERVELALTHSAIQWDTPSHHLKKKQQQNLAVQDTGEEDTGGPSEAEPAFTKWVIWQIHLIHFVSFLQPCKHLKALLSQKDLLKAELIRDRTQRK